MTKDTLLDAVWPETAISDAVARVAIGEVRRALGDTAQVPRFITGLVVVGEVGEGARHGPLALGETPNLGSRARCYWRSPRSIVGRRKPASTKP